MLTAWGDESGSIPDKDPGTYIMAAAMVEEEHLAPVRDEMLRARLPGESKTHWKGSRSERRQTLAEAVADLPLTAVVVVHHQTGAGERRHRRKCLETLLPQIALQGCSSLTLESRGGQDQSNRDLLNLFRSRRVLSRQFDLGHVLGREEPVLCIADIICGAVVQSRVGAARYLDILRGTVEIIEISE